MQNGSFSRFSAEPDRPVSAPTRSASKVVRRLGDSVRLWRENGDDRRFAMPVGGDAVIGGNIAL